MITGRLLLFIFPFIKEMVLGKTPIGEAVVYHKRRVLLVGLILLSFLLNILLIPKLISISMDFVSLDKKYKSVEYIVQENEGLRGNVDALKINVKTLADTNLKLVTDNKGLKEQVSCLKMACPDKPVGDPIATGITESVTIIPPKDPAVVIPSPTLINYNRFNYFELTFKTILQKEKE